MDQAPSPPPQPPLPWIQPPVRKPVAHTHTRVDSGPCYTPGSRATIGFFTVPVRSTDVYVFLFFFAFDPDEDSRQSMRCAISLFLCSYMLLEGRACHNEMNWGTEWVFCFSLLISSHVACLARFSSLPVQHLST